MAGGYAELLEHYVKISGERCGKCRGLLSSPQAADLAATVEWDVGYDVIGDFMHCGGRVIAHREIISELVTRFCGACEVKAKFSLPQAEPANAKKKTKKKDVMPDLYPEIAVLHISKEIDPLPQSTVSFSDRCSGCGSYHIESLTGVEQWDLRAHTPRVDGSGLFVRSEDLDGCDFFRPRHSGYVLCTDRVREFVLERGYTNVRFLEFGNVIE